MGSVPASLCVSFERVSGVRGQGSRRGWLVQDALQVLGQREDDALDVGLQLGQRARLDWQLLALRLRLRNEETSVTARTRTTATSQTL